ncbi:MAG: SIS domain-containing protein [Actinobacteria bacterium]|nr:SIS domain-containing protein [Actinomycetota bacterium]
MTSPYELDIADQPRALTALLAADQPDLGSLRASGFDKIVLTGMGSSHYAAYSTWRELLGVYPTWWVPTSELLDLPGLVDERTLLWITSQSGASGEVVELLDRLDAGVRPHTILATTNEPDSPLGRRADLVLGLHCGDEYTVTTKSYVNTLVVHALAARQLAGTPTEQVLVEAQGLAPVIQAVLDEPLPDAVMAALDGASTLAMVGGVAGGITAQTGALITKESAKVAVEGYVGGAFRHGPYEMAGRPELSVIIFTADADRTTSSLRQLSDDLVAAGTRVVTIGPDAWPGTTHVPTPATGGELTELVTGFLRVEQLTVKLAERSGLVPGKFFHGQKVTSAL